MNASQYPVTTGYGQIPGYPLNGGFHRGEDRAMPIGTSVLVNGLEIAKSGTNAPAGTVGAGPHLHIGRFVNGQATPPNGEGFTLKQPATVYDTDTIGVDPTDGKYVRILDGDGVLWVYLHLSQVEVTKGQLIKGEEMAINQSELALLTSSILNRQPVAGDSGYVGRNWQEVATEFYNSGEHKAIIAQFDKAGALEAQAADLEKQLAAAGGQATVLSPGKYEVK